MQKNLKREAVNAIINKKKGKQLLQPISQHPMDQQGSSCCHKLLTVVLSYHSKVTPSGALNDKKIAEAVLLHVQ